MAALLMGLWAQQRGKLKTQIKITTKTFEREQYINKSNQNKMACRRGGLEADKEKPRKFVQATVAVIMQQHLRGNDSENSRRFPGLL